MRFLPLVEIDKAIPNMIKNIFGILLFITQIVFGQNPPTQEDKIYKAIDVYTTTPTQQKLSILTKTSSALN